MRRKSKGEKKPIEMDGYTAKDSEEEREREREREREEDGYIKRGRERQREEGRGEERRGEESEYYADPVKMCRARLRSNEHYTATGHLERPPPSLTSLLSLSLFSPPPLSLLFSPSLSLLVSSLLSLSLSLPSIFSLTLSISLPLAVSTFFLSIWKVNEVR